MATNIMWKNFKSMPFVMKIMVIQGIISLVGAIVSLFPIGKFNIGEKEVSYYEWWSSGVGVLFFITAASLGIGVIFILKKFKNARIIYFSILTIILMASPIIDLIETGNKAILMMASVILILAYWYLFRKSTVQNYFDTDNLN